MTSLDIDTRSDIYALGVLLYELLVGKTPFDGKELLRSGLDAMRRTIREKEPIRPSTRLSQELVAADVRRLKSPDGSKPATEEEVRASSRRLLQTKEFIQLLRGDVDWIVMKCLEKDRTRRYETANGLAADIKRFLNQEPILARPPSTAYRVQKFVRRNKIGVAASVAVACALVLGVVVSTLQAVRATRAEREQSRLREQAEANELKAQQARNAEATLRRQAQAQAYVSDMNVAQQSLAMKNLGRAQTLLRNYLSTTNTAPSAASTPVEDLRGFEWRYLWQRSQGQETFSLRPYSNRVSCVVFSPDGKTFATGGWGQEVKVWLTSSHKRLTSLPPSEGSPILSHLFTIPCMIPSAFRRMENCSPRRTKSAW